TSREGAGAPGRVRALGPAHRGTPEAVVPAGCAHGRRSRPLVPAPPHDETAADPVLHAPGIQLEREASTARSNLRTGTTAPEGVRSSIASPNCRNPALSSTRREASFRG